MDKFLKSYKEYAEREGLNPDPFDLLHFYDYKAYWDKYGKMPGPGEHGDSRFKIIGHPNLIVKDQGKWIDTRTGEPATQKLVEENIKANAKTRKQRGVSLDETDAKAPYLEVEQ